MEPLMPKRLINGLQRLKLAEQYEGLAKDLEANGFYHFAKSLRRLSKSYESEAQREIKINPWGDDRE